MLAIQLDMEQFYERAERNNVEYKTQKSELVRYRDDNEVKMKTQYFSTIRNYIEGEH